MTKDPHDRTPNDKRSDAQNASSRESQDALDDRSLPIQGWEDEEWAAQRVALLLLLSFDAIIAMD
jgi:hypothetical protein